MKMGAVVLDSDISEELANFYQRLLGWSKESQLFEGDTWYVVKSTSGEGVPLVFQQVDDYKIPTWPSAGDFQQQMLHLDFYVKFDAYSDEIEHAVSCGAKISEVQLSESWKVMLDPAGHPFCIIPIPEDSCINADSYIRSAEK